MSGRFIEQRLLVLVILLFSPQVMFWEKEIYSTNLWWESEVSGVLNLRENKLNKNDYFRSMSAKAVMLKIESSKCITTVHHWSSVNHSFHLNFAWNLQIRILLDVLYETIKYFRFIQFDKKDCNWFFEVIKTTIFWSISYILRYFSSKKYFHDKKLTSYLEVTELLVYSSLEQLVFERNIRKRRII